MSTPANALDITQSGLVKFDGTSNFTGVTTTNHNVLIGGVSNGITNVAPSATIGVALVSGGAAADPSFTTVSVGGGGTGATTLTGILTGNGTSAITASTVTQHGILVGGASNAVSSTAVGTTGQVLQANTGADPTYSTATYPSTAGTNLNFLVSNGTNFTSSAFNIVPDTGTTLVGNSLNLRAKTGSASLSGATVKFNGSSSTEIDLALTDGSDNIFFGRVAGNGSYTGTQNIGVGSGTFQNLTSGGNNVGIGFIALNKVTTTAQDVAVGEAALANDAGVGSNTAIGFNSLNALTSGISNTAIGNATSVTLSTGSRNIIIGTQSGSAYVGAESDNILMNHSGVAAESNVIRIGTTGSGSGLQNKCFIGGITGVTPSNIQPVAINSSTGQLGVAVTVASNTGNSAAPAATASTAAYVMMGLGSSWKITPTTFTSVRITINGQLRNDTTGDGINIIMAFGTGAAPVNGAAVTGTTVGINTIFTDLTGLLTNGVPFSKQYIVTSLTAGTAYWFDLQFKAVTGGNASCLNLEFTAQELVS